MPVTSSMGEATFTCDQSRTEFEGEQVERKVPWRDEPSDSEGSADGVVDDAGLFQSV